MADNSFGEELAEARRRIGLSVEQVSDTLRIRPDIIRAIEMEDFARMPAKGFARNQVSAYARYLSLDPVEFTQRFLSAYNDFERASSSGGYVTDRQAPSGDRAYSAARRARRQPQGGSRQGGSSRPRREGSSGSRRPSSQREGNRPPQQRRKPDPRRQQSGGRKPGSSRRPAPSRGNGGRSRAGLGGIGARGFKPGNGPLPVQRLGLIAIAIIVLIIAIVIISRCTAGAAQSNSTQETVQVTGGTTTNIVMDDTSANALTTMPEVKSTLSQFAVTVSAVEGNYAWVQVVADGEQVYADTLTGPDQEKFSAKETLVVKSWNAGATKVSSGSTDYQFVLDEESVGTVSLKLVDGEVIQE